MPGFDANAVRDAVFCDVGARLGPQAVEEARSAASWLMVTFHQGLPKPVQRADGSWAYEGPAANAAVRTQDGWIGWHGGVRRPLAAASSAEIDRILADSAFWAEPAHIPPTCTDAGAQRLVVRHGRRETVRQQACGGRGLTERLFRIVLDGR